VAERVLEEGELLEGQERETVALRNDHGRAAGAQARGAREQVPGRRLAGRVRRTRAAADHAARAVAGARDIVRAVEERFGGDVEVGIGLSSGTVVVGSSGVAAGSSSR
jgi:class 3 adenylate cyclase